MESVLSDVCLKTKARKYEEALSVIANALEQSKEGHADLLFVAGCIFFVRGNADLGSEYVKLSFQTGTHSPLSIRFGQRVFDQAGEEGKELVTYFRRNRFWPLAHRGSVAAGLRYKSELAGVEPWYFSRKMASLFPDQSSLSKGVTPDLVRETCLKGWLPISPLFNRDSKVLTVGSCFAEELRNYFLTHDISTEVVFVPPGLNNTFALRSYFRWIETGVAEDQEMWFEQAAGGGVKWKPDIERRVLLETFKDLDCIVLTVGLAEIWEDNKTDKVFWRGVPRSLYDPDRHICRLSSTEENIGNLVAAIASLRSIAPRAEIILSLSPIPLKATQTGVSCVTADCLSKSVHRVAIASVMEKKLERVRYWPSFEIVRWLSGHVEKSFFGEDGSSRHVNRFAVELILREFINAYFDIPSDNEGALEHSDGAVI